MHCFGTLVITTSLWFILSDSINNGFKTPILGYTTWYDTRWNQNESYIKEITNALISTGLAAKGYEYVCLDSGYAVGRNSTTNDIIINSTMYPSGMAAMGQWIHSKGMKFGLYADRGLTYCGPGPDGQGPNGTGSYGYYAHDAEWYVKQMKVDYVKFDSCLATQDPTEALNEYIQIGNYLQQNVDENAVNPKVWYALCGWAWWYAINGSDIGNSFRINGDSNYWTDFTNTLYVVATQTNRFGKIGGYSDLDLLQATTAQGGGWGNFTNLQSRAQFTMYTVMTSPILLGARIMHLNQYLLDTYGNDEALEVFKDTGRENKEEYYIQGNTLYIDDNWGQNKGVMVYGKALSDGGWGVVFLNNYDIVMNITCDRNCLERLGYFPGTVVRVRDIWMHSNVGNMTLGDGYNESWTVYDIEASGGVQYYRITPA